QGHQMDDENADVDEFDDEGDDGDFDSAAWFEMGEDSVALRYFAPAVESFRRAWEVLPEPKSEHPLAVQILAAISDCEFYLGNWQACYHAMQEALRCGASLANPFVRLRLGQSLYELGNEREAENWLVPAYLTEGRALFEGDDPKYLEFIRGKLRPPEGGWPEGW